jgi:prepilin-type N-terminal cleavage/methylation domain-containing protein
VKRRSTTGFSLLELLVVAAIGSIMTVIAIPMTLNGVRSYRLSAAVSSATGAIQSTRYLAIMHGYSYQITFTPSTNSYQVLNEVPPATSFSNVGTAVPISGPDAVLISRVITIQFSANGTVSEITTPPNGVPALVFQIANINTNTGLAYTTAGWSNTLTVSGVGNVSVTSP